MSQIPTILIGLGGTGSTIVDKIYALIPEERKRLVAIHAFDTDVNDIESLENLNKDEIIQTSTDYTVGEYLQVTDNIVKDWFPHEIKELKRKNLTDGAGQVRSISRLAYRAALENNALSSLQSSISKIKLLCETDRISGIRVMIVTTLAGGTGAGIFLQTAMYVRELLNVDFGQQNVLIRGVFILPDIFVLTGTLDKGEFDNVQSNAYASIKELNAIIRATNAGATNLQIEMEYKPNQTDDNGRSTLNLGFNNLPYDYCVLFDYENIEGKNIGCLDNYINMIVKTTYFDLFTPMSNRLFSKQDNQIRTLAQNEGLSRFCSSSLATIMYPYHDIVNYMSLKWVCSFLSDQWLIIDQKVEEEHKTYEEDIAKGVLRDKFNIGERFTKNIQELSTTDVFFRSLIRETGLLDEKNEVVDNKSDLFLNEVSNRIQQSFTNDSKLNETSKLCKIREDELREKQTAKKEVGRVESLLKEYKNNINAFILNNKKLFADDIIFKDLRKVLKMEENQTFETYNCPNKFELNHWLLNATNPVHPLTVRYIVYELINKLDEKIKMLNRETSEILKSIDQYEEKAYDLPETESLVETAEDRIRIALKQKFISKIFATNQFKEFMEEFIEKSSGQLLRLNQYKQKKLELEVYQLAFNNLNDLSEDFKKYFNILNNIKNTLHKELNLLEQKHEESADPMTLYVLSRKIDKNILWDNIRRNYAEQMLPPNISKQIYMSLYLRLCKKVNNIYTSVLIEDSIEKIFRDSVVNWCTSKIAKEERLDLSIFEALQKEAEHKEIADDAINNYKAEKIKSLNELAKPFIRRPINLDLAEISAWGVNTCIDQSFSPALINQSFGNTEVVKNESFSKYEVVKESMIYGLMAENLTKLIEPDGRYYKAYKRVINQMRTNSNTVTPHLDKRWHLPAYLPSLTDAAIKNDEEKINKAFIVGISMGYLIQLNDYGKYAWYYRGDSSGMQVINIATDTPAEEKPYNLYNALLYNPAIVDKILDKFEEDIKIEKIKFSNIEDHTFYKNIQEISLNTETINLYQLLFSYTDDLPSEPKLVMESLSLIKTAVLEMKNYFIYVIGVHRETEAKIQLRDFSVLLKANSSHYTSADKLSTRFVEWESALANIESK